MDHLLHAPTAQFLRRIVARSSLTREEQGAILELTGPKQWYAAHEDIVRPGETVQSACLVVKGLVARYDQMLNGSRQVTAYYIAGDMCDLHSMVAPQASWAIVAVGQAAIIRIPHEQLKKLCLEYPAIAFAFWRDGTADASVFGKWIGNIGRRNARARIAHLLCEMGTRMEAAGLGERTSFDFHVSQAQLADATGMTAVHVNRTLQDMRKEKLFAFSHGHVEIFDWDTLAAVAEFDPAYLLLDRTPHRLDDAERERAHIHL